MNLYDKSINECMKLLEGRNAKRLESIRNSREWRESDEQKLIMKRDMAYELGGGILPAVSGLAFTTSEYMEDEILLYGPDLQDISEDTPYARITIINIDDSKWNDSNEAYAGMRRIDYTRYHVYPEGFMMRISTSADRESVRIGKKELKAGLDFEKAGNIFINAYHRHSEVKSVKIIFITDKTFEYDKLSDKVIFIEKITESLNKIFNNIIMDCKMCELKEVCDEVEGLRELHFKS